MPVHSWAGIQKGRHKDKKAGIQTDTQTSRQTVNILVSSYV